MSRRGGQWYACADLGGLWPQMLGPYDETRARGEAGRMADGFAVGFATNADRADFLRRWEDARSVPGARAAIVAQLAGEVGADSCPRCGEPPMPLGLCTCPDEPAAVASMDADGWAELDAAQRGQLPARGGFVQHVGAVGCDDCERSYGPGALCRCEADPCSSCGAFLCEGDCEQGRDDDPPCTGCPGGCLECAELGMRDGDACPECGGPIVWGAGPSCANGCELERDGEARAAHDADMRARAEYGDPTAIAWGEQ